MAPEIDRINVAPAVQTDVFKTPWRSKSPAPANSHVAMAASPPILEPPTDRSNFLTPSTTL